MDLIKIGKYISDKRKALGLTQRQLAEKVGMSDKSVSKWERGVCLPDVSIYAELCSALDISVNEFLAGEDIESETLEQKAEENLIGVATQSKQKQKRLKSIIAVLLIISMGLLSVIGGAILYANRPQNYFAPLDNSGNEIQIAAMLSDADNVYSYEFHTSEEFSSLEFFVSEYQYGELVNKESFGGLCYNDIASPEHGTIYIVPYFKDSLVKLIIVEDGARYSTEIPILTDAPKHEHCGRSATQIAGKTPIRFNEEQGLVALIYDQNEMRLGSIEEYEQGIAPTFDDYVYYFSFQFSS